MTKHKQHELTAVIYDKRGMVLSIGKNSYTKSHPEMAKYSKKIGNSHAIFLHAEVAAIIKCRHLSPYKIKITRYDKKGNPKLAKPCPACELAIKEAGIQLIEYTIGD